MIAATVEWRLAVTPVTDGVPLPDVAVVVCASGLLVTFAGLAVWRLRPHGVTGPLLAVAGCGVLLSGLAGVRPVAFDIAGSLAWAVFPLAIAHLLWGYPNGLRGRSGIAAAWAAGSFRPRSASRSSSSPTAGIRSACRSTVRSRRARPC